MVHAILAEVLRAVEAPRENRFVLGHERRLALVAHKLLAFGTLRDHLLVEVEALYPAFLAADFPALRAAIQLDFPRRMERGGERDISLRLPTRPTAGKLAAITDEQCITICARASSTSIQTRVESEPVCLHVRTHYRVRFKMHTKKKRG